MLHWLRCSAAALTIPAGLLAVVLPASADSGHAMPDPTSVTSAPPEDRITKSDWFVRKHRRIEPAVWRHASVKSAANCAACHTGADRGQFNDGDLRVPPGLDPKLTRGWKD